MPIIISSSDFYCMVSTLTFFTLPIPTLNSSFHFRLPVPLLLFPLLPLAGFP